MDAVTISSSVKEKSSKDKLVKFHCSNSGIGHSWKKRVKFVSGTKSEGIVQRSYNNNVVSDERLPQINSPVTLDWYI